MKHFSFKGALRSLLLLSLVAVFATGCGDSRDDFVSLNNNNGQTGNLVFRFQQAVTQAVDTVPAGTTTLRFDLFSGSPPSQANFVETRTEPFSTVVTLTGVPSNVNTVVVTAFNNDNVPTVTLQGPAPVAPGSTVDVDLNDSTPITFQSIAVTPDPATAIYYRGKPFGTTQLIITGTFSNGTVVPLPITNTTASFSFPRSGIANVSSTGLLSVGGDEPDNVTATANYTIGSTTVSDTFTARTFAFFPEIRGSSNISTTGGYSGGYDVIFYDDNGASSFNLVNTSANLIYGFANPAPTGLSINSSTGELTSTGTTPTGTFNVTITWVDTVRSDASGETFVDCVQFNVQNPI